MVLCALDLGLLGKSGVLVWELLLKLHEEVLVLVKIRLLRSGACRDVGPSIKDAGMLTLRGDFPLVHYAAHIPHVAHLCDIASLTITMVGVLNLATYSCRVSRYRDFFQSIILIIATRQLVVKSVDTRRVSLYLCLGYLTLLALLHVAQLVFHLLLLPLLHLIFIVVRASQEHSVSLVHLTDRLHRVLQRFKLLLVVFTLAVDVY